MSTFVRGMSVYFIYFISFFHGSATALRDFIEKQKILSEARRFHSSDKDFLICTCNCQLFFLCLDWLIWRLRKFRKAETEIIIWFAFNFILFFRECKFDSKCQKKISWSIDQSLLSSHNRGSTVKSRKLKPFLLGWFYQTLCKVG